MARLAVLVEYDELIFYAFFFFFVLQDGRVVARDAAA